MLEFKLSCLEIRIPMLCPFRSIEGTIRPISIIIHCSSYLYNQTQLSFVDKLTFLLLIEKKPFPKESQRYGRKSSTQTYLGNFYFVF